MLILPCSNGLWQNNLMVRKQMAEGKNEDKATRLTRGRPRLGSRVARPHRVVTFVTERELQYLTQVVNDEDRSMASVVHRIIVSHIKTA